MPDTVPTPTPDFLEKLRAFVYFPCEETLEPLLPPRKDRIWAEQEYKKDWLEKMPQNHVFRDLGAGFVQFWSGLNCGVEFDSSGRSAGIYLNGPSCENCALHPLTPRPEAYHGDTDMSKIIEIADCQNLWDRSVPCNNMEQHLRFFDFNLKEGCTTLAVIHTQATEFLAILEQK